MTQVDLRINNNKTLNVKCDDDDDVVVEIHVSLVYLFNTVLEKWTKIGLVHEHFLKRYSEITNIINLLCSRPSKRKIGGILTACFKLWRTIPWWYQEDHSLLQGRTWVTAPEPYKKVHGIRTLCHLLQWANGQNCLPQGIWSYQCIYRIMWSHYKR